MLADVVKIETKEEGTVLTLRMENQRRDAYTYDEQFRICRLTGKEMEEIPMRSDYGWNDISYTLEGKKSARVKMNLEESVGKLKPGYYTVYKSLSKKKTGEPYTAAAGFLLAE